MKPQLPPPRPPTLPLYPGLQAEVQTVLVSVETQTETQTALVAVETQTEIQTARSQWEPKLRFELLM